MRKVALALKWVFTWQQFVGGISLKRGDAMKAVVLHEYGPPKNLKYEDFPDPKLGPDEVLIRVNAASINPVDWKMRSGAAAERFPVTFPGVLGRDLAGIVQAAGREAKGFAEGDRVFALAWHTYAELCVVKASELARVPDGLEIPTAGAVPLVALTGDQLMRRAVEIQRGQTVFLTGAVGSVGRCALFCALEAGAKVIAGVRKNQRDEARNLGAIEAIDLDDDDDIARVGFVDAVADSVGGKIAMKLLAKVKPGGSFGSLLGPPQGAALHPLVNIKPMTAQPDPAAIVHYAEAIRDGKLKLPIDRMMPLEEAAEAHSLAERGSVGKIVLLA
jgi:NADPH:quinone reductase-like Zn-dependent oxidoreductase